jgi:Xaa-Pro aminopeptidase
VNRLARLAGRLEEPLLVLSGVNVRYLTGFASSNAALLVEPGRTTLYTDFRYAEAAREVAGVELVVTPRDLLGYVAQGLAGRRLAFEAEHTSYASYRRLAAAGVELLPANGVVEELRAVKDADEIAAIRRAAAISDEMFEGLTKERFTRRTERELAWWVEQRLRELGADRAAFDVLVASGGQAARPHGKPRDVAIQAGTLVIVDAGAMVDGYCSDCTRTFATGDLPPSLADAYELCRRAQLDALAAIQPGVAHRAADAASRQAIEAAGLSEQYGHGAGHGVGLEVHEAPYLRQEAPEELVLQPGNVVTVEPGIYLPGVGGVRVEDLVLVTAAGHERLTTFTKDLLTVA